MRCPQCGTEFEADVEQCFTCGWDFRKSKGKRTGERIVVTGVLFSLLSIPVLLLFGFIIWCLDAGPVPNEFTEADLVQVRPENEASWDLLLQLDDEDDDFDGAPAIGLAKADVEKLEELWDYDPSTIEENFQYIHDHGSEIKFLWEKSAKGRMIIQKLAGYDEIADFIEPHIDALVPYFFDVRLLLKINLLHSQLLLEEGRDIQACKEIIAFDSVFRKHSCCARSLISKLTCYGVFEKDIYALSLIVNHANMSNDALLLLRSHFDSFTEEQLSLRNSFIHEYLVFKNSMEDSFSNKWNLLYKHNSVLRYYDAYCRKWIQVDRGEEPNTYSHVSVWPWNKPNYPKVLLDIDEATERFYDLYLFYNPIGSMQIKIMLPMMENIVKIKVKMQIEDDLFQWVLARRMGQEGSLKARAYSDVYTVDVEKGLVFSVGPDGEPYTDDDIKLRIDPVVLGLK